MLGVWGGRPGLPVPIELGEKSEVRSRVKVEVAVPGSPSLKVLTVCVDVRQDLEKNKRKSELRSCVQVAVAVLGFPSLVVLMVPMDVKQH